MKRHDHIESFTIDDIEYRDILVAFDKLYRDVTSNGYSILDVVWAINSHTRVTIYAIKNIPIQAELFAKAHLMFEDN